MDRILILDFGGQTTQLIARRIRELGVYTQILPGDTTLSDAALRDVRGIVMSGSPFSVAEPGAPKPDPRVYSGDLPVLGICYGLQRLMHDNGGAVEAGETREYGRARLHFVQKHPLFKDIPEGFVSWMSHGDSIRELAPGFDLVAESDNGLPACITARAGGFVGIQFHPEVSHCEYGTKILENFSVGICGARRDWSVDRYLEQIEQEVRGQAGDSPVILLISGGVDSTVVAALLLHALDPSQVHLMYVDTGLMRSNETAEVGGNLKQIGARHLYIVDAADEFLTALARVAEPEEKRRIIGDLFMTIQEREVARAAAESDIDLSNAILAQGTLYTDLIESGHGVGNKGALIKSHHNVRSPLVSRKREEGKLIEPLRSLYKDEVRALGERLGVKREIIRRHPFPGPGLAVRILGEVTREKCDILREADAIYIAELRKRNLYERIWQAFAVLLPVQSVGVTGDARHYGYVLALRAVASSDGMTADVFPFPMQDLLEISSIITNRVKRIGRVVYDVSSKPPATIEWE
ncbi:MAG TPA: glutamine-hydrolyzing GMP synthase [Spirochaetia bacterium]|nr:glutamine-hydrolyzing GMP synthase [Spirochaetia bacterium]